MWSYTIGILVIAAAHSNSAPFETCVRGRGSCSWNFDPRGDGQDLGPLLRQVDGSGKSCTSDSDCIAGLVCGQVGVRTFNPVTKQYQPTEEIRMECGHQIGLWSAYQLCVWSGNRYVSPSPFDGLIDCPAHHNMFACAGHEPWITTCYSEGSHEDGCCGCADWADILDIPVPQAHGCRGNSTTWEESALPYYEILKRGCPTAYTSLGLNMVFTHDQEVLPTMSFCMTCSKHPPRYAYDDESSTFTCQSANSRQEESEAAQSVSSLCFHGGFPFTSPSAYAMRNAQSSTLRLPVQHTQMLGSLEPGTRGHGTSSKGPADLLATVQTCILKVPHEVISNISVIGKCTFSCLAVPCHCASRAPAGEIPGFHGFPRSHC